MLSDKKENLASLRAEFGEWTAENQEVCAFATQINDQLESISLPQSLAFERAAEYFAQLAERLEEHFEKEQKLGSLLAAARGVATCEIEAARRQADKDHTLLLARLRKLIEATQADGTCRDQWNTLLYDFNLFIDLLEQHHDVEFLNVRSLIPSSA